jgi:hypothetical protein
MSNFRLRLDSRSLRRLPFAISMLGSFVLLALPVTAADDDFAGCTSGLLEAGVPAEKAIAACASARYPDALGDCVIDINDKTGIGAEDALGVCERSRRPDEVANCTIEIHDALLGEPSISAMEHCGRSLLPERFATCVVDLNDVADLNAEDALSRCIRAGYRPWEISPRL